MSQGQGFFSHNIDRSSGFWCFRYGLRVAPNTPYNELSQALDQSGGERSGRDERDWRTPDGAGNFDNIHSVIVPFHGLHGEAAAKFRAGTGFSLTWPSDACRVISARCSSTRLSTASLAFDRLPRAKSSRAWAIWCARNIRNSPCSRSRRQSGRHGQRRQVRRARSPRGVPSYFLRGVSDANGAALARRSPSSTYAVQACGLFPIAKQKIRLTAPRRRNTFSRANTDRSIAACGQGGLQCFARERFG